MANSTHSNENELDDGKRLRLLEAAAPVFAEHGFEGATLRDICAAAGANLAAVNYYFGGKLQLYVETINYWFGQLLAKYPPNLGVEPGASAEERLFAFVRSYFLRLFGGGVPEMLSAIILREMSQPTPAVELVAQRTVKPMRDLLVSIVTELLGEGATDDDIFRGATSIIGQIMFHRICNPMIRKLFPKQKYKPADIEALALHVTNFALSGLAMMRQEIGARA